MRRKMLWHALVYAEQYWPVFPCSPSKKIPLTPHGFKDATCSKDMIRDWWTRWPDANIGFAVPQNYIILDIDPRNDGSEGGLPGTRTVSTPAGGLHLYYWALTGDEAFTKQWRQGVDVKAPGKGYVLFPPSKTSAGKYEWLNRGRMTLLPRDVYDDITKAKRNRSPVRWPAAHAYSDNSAEGALAWSLQRLALATEGSRNDTLFSVTTFLVKVLFGSGAEKNLQDIALTKIEIQALRIGLDSFEVQRTMRSAYDAVAR